MPRICKTDKVSTRAGGDATVYKALLRSDLKIKVYSVTELSEDEDGLAGMLIEGVMELCH
jgi:hypothetical protein